MNILAVVGARKGSVRVPDKNYRPLPDETTLIGRAIARACTLREQGVVDDVLLSTDYEEDWDAPGVTWSRRPAHLAGPETRDAEWVADLLDHPRARKAEAVALIRPTSPFLKAETVRRGVEMFQAEKGVYCIKTVRPVSESPWKMWSTYDERWTPLLAGDLPAFDYQQYPWDGPTFTEDVYIQTGGLDIVPVTNIIEEGFLVGHRPTKCLVVDGWEGLDVNVEADWLLAETAIERGFVS